MTDTARSPSPLRDLAIQHLKAGLALFVFVALYPVKYHALHRNLDSYWVAALNYLHLTGAVFGKDIEFTYGPLAYLALPMPFGNNIEHGVLFQLGTWLTLGALLAWLLFRQHVPLVNWLVLGICAPAGAQLFRASPTDGPDYFLEALVVLLTAASLAGPAIFYFAAVFFAALLLLIKLSGGIAAVAVILIFPLALALTNRTRATRLLCIAAVELPLVVVVCFWLSGGSLSALAKYLRAGFEISSGYVAAMSEEGPVAALWAAMVMLAGFVALAVVLYYKKDRAFPISVAVLPLLFLEHKHSFVRQDAHVEILFKLAPLILAATLLLTDLDFRRWASVIKMTSLVALTLVAAPWLYFERGHYYFHKFAWEESASPFASFARIGDVFDLGGLNLRLWEESDRIFESSHFPRPLRERIGARTIGIYPANAVYAAANNLHLIPLPILQTYSAYTAYLDGWDAGLLNDPQRRPELMLLSWVAIDERHPLLDCPQTALALYRNYEFDSIYGGLMLLRARENPMPFSMPLAGHSTMIIGQPFHLSAGQNPVLRIFPTYNFRGHMAEFFFRIPPVYATLSGAGGRSITHRIPPGVLPGGVSLLLMPADWEDARLLFETGRTAAAFDTITISGGGTIDFVPTARVEIYEGPALATAATVR